MASACPIARTMTILEDGTLVSESENEASDDEEMPALLVEEVDYANEAEEGESLVTLRFLNT